MGAALCLAHRQGKIQFRTLPFEKMHAYMGRNKSGEVTLDQIKEAFPDYKIRSWQESSQVLADGEVVAIFQGPSEVGPRALGNRTLMVRPDRKEVKKYLNENIKFREEFRPYGATVLQEDVHVYFDVDKGFIAPFMTFAPLIRKEKESYLTGVTHKDMTSRIQTISREQNQRYYDIIKGFKSITGESVILNTSLNIMGQPILEDLTDAKSFMKDSKVRFMVINDYLLEKL
jgi:carbamoyltransferase